MKAIVINLERQSDRRDYVPTQLRKLGIDYHVLAATDARDLSDETVKEVLSPRFYTEYQQHKDTYISLSAVACALSHRRAYQYILDHDDDNGAWLILEDDADLQPKAKQALSAMESTVLNEGVDLLLLYFSVRDTIELEKASCRALSGGMSTFRWQGSPGIASAVGYIISASAARSLVQAQTPLSTTADHWQWFFQQKVISEVRVTYPFAVTTGLLESTFATGRARSMRRWLMSVVGEICRVPALYRLFLYLRRWNWSGKIQISK